LSSADRNARASAHGRAAEEERSHLQTPAMACQRDRRAALYRFFKVSTRPVRIEFGMRWLAARRIEVHVQRRFGEQHFFAMFCRLLLLEKAQTK
jgi:hypothetical protein